MLVKRWESERAQELGDASRRIPETMSPPMALCEESQAGKLHMGGRLCSWIVTRRTRRGMYGTLGADLEVQHTNKRAELTAFLSLFSQGLSAPTTAHVDTKRNH